MKRLALVAALISFVSPLLFAQAAQDQKTQDQDNKKEAVATVGSKKDKKNGKEEKKEEPQPEKKGGMTADTFSGLKFRSIGPAIASGRVMSIAVNPRKEDEYYVGVASGGVWKTVNNGTTGPPCLMARDRIRSGG